jgi:hypothetical protein
LNWRKRLTAALLSLAMALSLFAPWPQTARAAGTGAAGSIGLTVRFDLPQTRAAVEGRGVKLTLTRGTERLELPLAAGTAVRNDFQAPVSVKAKNIDGVEMTTEARLGYYQAEVSGLAQGTYRLEVTGTGYVPYSADVTLDSYSRHVITGTGDGTFALGDVNGDGVLDEQDLTYLEARLGGAPEGCDLNGDGAVDVTDLAYVNYILNEHGSAQILETGAITVPVVETAGLIFRSGTAQQLFTGTESVTIAPAAAGDDLVLPIELPAAVEMERIEITCPDGMGALETGAATVETEDGRTFDVPFDISTPAGVYAIGPTAGERVVTIDLGRRVAVKKVTIHVTRVAGQAGAKPEYATVTQIEFLKDIVPENPKTDDQVMNLSAKAGDGMVELAWSAVRNVTGYEVAYGESADNLDRKLPVVTNKASVTGLENLTTYYFQVTATNGAWSGRPSAIVSAMPEAAKVPGAPSNIGVVPMDGALRLSWGKTKDATFYQAFYRVAGETEFTQFGGDLSATSTTITGLTNGTEYELAVKAGNSKGVGPFSAIAAGTPEREDLTMPELPADGRIAKEAIIDITMEDSTNVNRELCPNFTTAHLIDEDASTYWIARHYIPSSYITYTFAEPHDMNYFIIVPYLNTNYKNRIAEYKFRAMDEAGNVISEGIYPAPAVNAENYMVMSFPEIKGVKSIAIGLNEKTGGPRVSISEIAFYNSDTLPDDTAALFADGCFTTLKDTVTEADIAALEARLEEKTDFYLATGVRKELEIARGLLANDPTVLGLVKNDFQSRSGGKDSTYGQSASDLQPLGISAKAETTVTIYAQLPEGETVSVVPTQYYGESGIWRGTSVQLRNGRNHIYIPKIGSLTDPRGGPLYVTYSGEHPEQIKLHVLPNEKAAIIPVLELSSWYGMDETAQRDAISAYVTALEAHVAKNGTNPETNVFNTTEISTPSVLLSLPANKILDGLGTDNKVETMYQNILAWEETLFVANKVQGIIGSADTLAGYRYPMQTRQNIRYMRMFAGAFMYAAGNHVGIGYGSASALAQGRPTSSGNPMLFGWGIAHEIGHNMDKLGKAEITNNIYALAIQAWDGGGMTKNTTRLTNSGIWQKIFDKVSVGRPGAAGNVFVQLGMYWQLHLAYDDKDNPLEFFNSFFKAWKDKTVCSNFSGDDRFAVIAAQTAGHNLNPFFERWGLTLSGEAKAEIQKLAEEPRAIWYLNDESWINGTAGTGNTTVAAAVEGSKVTLTINNDASGTIQGYEVRRDGVAIGFTTTNTYTDDLGAANNRTYKYSVVPVDKLGNMGQEAETQELRVAYDKAISEDLYEMSRAGTTVTFTMKGDAKVAVTGIKVENSTVQSPGITINGKDVNATPAPDNAGVWYFAKPGAAAGDTRIWTYDAKTVTITGVPEGAVVTLLDYPGDRVDFYDAKNVTAGKLAEDYSYVDSDGKTQTIPKGTVVVMGTYRGDPVYTLIQIEARYDISGEAVTDATELQPRCMNGFTLLFAEIPGDGEVSDISDGIFMFVPDWAEENKLNKEAGWSSKDPLTDKETDRTLYPTEIRAVLNRTDKPESADSHRTTSETLWISFPHAEALTDIRLTSSAN